MADFLQKDDAMMPTGVIASRGISMASLARLALCGMVLAGVSYGTTPARAEAFAGVDRAIWTTNIGQTLPAGLTFSCFGDITQSGLSNCGDAGSLTITNGSATSIAESLSLVGGFSITNTTGTNITTPFVDIGISAFNPGGSDVGASVDYPSAEYATFSSRVAALSGSYLLVSDFHSCGIGNGPDFGTLITPTSCGVFTPDESTYEIDPFTLAPGQSFGETFEIDITATARGVPEPGTLAIFGAGMAGAMVIRRRRRKSA